MQYSVNLQNAWCNDKDNVGEMSGYILCVRCAFVCVMSEYLRQGDVANFTLGLRSPRLHEGGSFGRTNFSLEFLTRVDLTEFNLF